MQRHPRGVFTTTVYPLLAAAGLIAMSGCAAVPAMNLAGTLFRPAQPAQTAQPAPATQPGQVTQPVQASQWGTPAPSMLSSLAQQFGITLPGQSDVYSAVTLPAPARPAAEAPTTTAAK